MGLRPWADEQARGCGTPVSGTCAPGGCGNSQNVCAYRWQGQPIASCYDAPGQGVDCLQDPTQQVTCTIGVPEERCFPDGTCDTQPAFCTTITLTMPACTGNQIDRNCEAHLDGRTTTRIAAGIEATGFSVMQSRASLSLTCIVFCLIAPRATGVCEAADDAPTVEALAVLIDEWQAAASFKCHFRRRLLRCSSVDAVLNGNGVEIPDEVFPAKAKGWLYKLGPKARLGVDYDAPPRELGPSDIPGIPERSVAKAVTNVSFDEVGNAQFEIRFEPRRGDFGDAAWIAVKPANRRSIAAPGQRSTAWINPLTPLNSDVPNPLRFYEPGNSDSLAPDAATLREVSRDRIEVILKKHILSLQATESRSVVLWTKTSLPVVERIDNTIDLPDGRRIEDHVALSDFCNCSGAMVARVVRHAIPAPPRDGQAGFTLVEWRSDDLGNDAPTDDDFVIELGEQTMIIGFAKPIPRGGIRKLNIDEIKLDDLDTTGGARQPKGTPVSSRARPRSNHNIIALVLLNLAFGGALVWLWARLRKRRAD